MNRINKSFKNKNGSLFVAYLTAGDPDYDTSKALYLELVRQGVDILEVGIPFSDPLADGAVIQEASDRSLKSGMTVKKALSLVSELRQKTKIPIVLFTYLNPVYQYGIEAFANDAKNAGVDGVLFLDLPPEEAKDIKKTLKKNKLHMIFLIAPTSNEERIKKIVKYASGFIYYVSRTGVTGMQNELSSDIEEKVKAIRSCTDVPIVVGFGISKPEHVGTIAQIADGYVVGSALVNQIKEYSDTDQLIHSMGEFASSLNSKRL